MLTSFKMQHIVFVLAIVACYCFGLDEAPYGRSQAIVFETTGLRCPSEPCTSASFSKVYFHMIVGVNHQIAPNLLAHRLCAALQMCVPPERILLVLQRQSKDKTNNYKQCKKVMKDAGVNHFDDWIGDFDPNQKMAKTYSILQNLTSSNDLIFHTDLDEFPDRDTLAQAIQEIDANACDAIQALWVDRLDENGALRQLQADSSVDTQFPLRCDMSTNFVGGQFTRKTILYRGPFRLDGGQHDVWCDRDGISGDKKKQMIQQGDWSFDQAGPEYNMQNEWNYRKACHRHIMARNKGDEFDMIMNYLGKVPYRPRICKTTVILDHYKWTAGIREYLYKRAIEYRDRGLHWWRDSRDILLHLQHHEGFFCVHCEESACRDVRVGYNISIKPDEIFFSRRDHYGRRPQAIEKKKRSEARRNYLLSHPDASESDLDAAADKAMSVLMNSRSQRQYIHEKFWWENTLENGIEIEHKDDVSNDAKKYANWEDTLYGFAPWYSSVTATRSSASETTMEK